MEELFLETQNGLVPLSQDIIVKFNLKKGLMSPFTNCRIVDKNGNFDIENKETKAEPEPPSNDSMMFTTAESIDISQGVDSQ